MIYDSRSRELYYNVTSSYLWSQDREGGRKREVLEKFFLWPQRPPWDWHFLNVKGLFRMYTRNSGYTKVSFHPYNFFIEADNIFSRIPKENNILLNIFNFAMETSLFIKTFKNKLWLMMNFRMFSDCCSFPAHFYNEAQTLDKLILQMC